MIRVVDVSVAIKWFAEGDWGLREDGVEPVLEILKASIRRRLDFYKPPHFLAEVALWCHASSKTRQGNTLRTWLSST